MSVWAVKPAKKSDYDFLIQSANFTKDINIKRGEQLILKLEGRDLETGEEAIEVFGCGKGWESPGNNRALSEKTGSGDEKFGENSEMGKLIKGILAMENAQAVFERVPDPARTDGWVGMKFHVSSVKNSFTDKDTKEVKEFSTNFFAKYLGVEGEESPEPTPVTTAPVPSTKTEEKKAAVPPKTDTAPAPAATVEKKTSTPKSTKDKVLMVQLKSLFDKSADAKEFEDKALKLDDVVADSSLCAKVMEGTLFEQFQAEVAVT